jgi:DNA-binding NtrC family response regulator
MPSAPPQRPSEGEAVTVLAVAFPPDPGLRCILGHTRWSLREAFSLREAATELRNCPGAIVISEPALPDGTWKELLDFTLTLHPAPPLVIAAIHADESLWMEVLNCGGYNVISKPFDGGELVQMVSLAWLRTRDKARTGAEALGG